MLRVGWPPHDQYDVVVLHAQDSTVEALPCLWKFSDFDTKEINMYEDEELLDYTTMLAKLNDPCTILCNSYILKTENR